MADPIPPVPRRTYITQQHMQREELPGIQTFLTEPKFTGHPKIMKAQRRDHFLRSQYGEGGDPAPPAPAVPKGLGTAGTRTSLSPGLHVRGKGPVSRPHSPASGVACPQSGVCRAAPPTQPYGTWDAAGPRSCSMLSAGQRCYSGPAAGVALADRVSASNASHAPTATVAGGGTRPAPRSSARSHRAASG